MPLLEHDRAIKEFYENYKDKHPEIEYDHFVLICKSPFLAIRAWIKSGKFYFIFIKYLGKFKVSKRKISEMITVNELKYKDGTREEEDYLKRKTFLEQYLKDLKEYDSKDKEVD